MPVIGYVGAQSPAAFASRVRAFRRRNRIWRGSKCRNRISMGGGSRPGRSSGGRGCRARRRSCRARGRMALWGSPN
jgi:hypothetical protein